MSQRRMNDLHAMIEDAKQELASTPDGDITVTDRLLIQINDWEAEIKELEEMEGMRDDGW